MPWSIPYLTRNGPAKVVLVHTITIPRARTVWRRYGRSMSAARRMTCLAVAASRRSASSTPPCIHMSVDPRHFGIGVGLGRLRGLLLTGLGGGEHLAVLGA